AVTHAMTMRTIRRLAGATGKQISDDTLDDMATRLLTARPDDFPKVLDMVMDELSKIERSTVAQLAYEGNPGFGVGQQMRDAFDRTDAALAGAEVRAGQALINGLRTANPAAEAAAAEAISARAPRIEGEDLSRQITEAQKQLAELEAQVQQAEQIRAARAQA